ncbi:MAG: 30S ribosomal protein S2, partial [Bacteroidales bacterium]|nr:30S ribosomal protein S2 [Bacteroidales bacterium]
QRAKLEKNLGSIADLNRLPSALFIVDIQKEMNAVKEANRLNIPVIAMVDTCCDPGPIDFVIPANDDAAKSISLIMERISQAISEGLAERKLEKEKEGPAENKDSSAPESGSGSGKRTRVRKVVQKGEGTPEAEVAPAVEAAAEVAPVEAAPVVVVSEAIAPEAAE